MASEKVDSIIESIETLNVLELVELKKAMEEKWDVTAAAPMMAGAVAMPGAPGDGADAPAAAVEKDSFDVILTDAGANKIQVIKAVRELSGGTLGLKEAKELVEGAPKPVKEGVSKEDAEEAKTKLTDVGAGVEIK